MKQKELQKMIEAGVVDTITFFRPVKSDGAPISDWEIWAEGIPGDNVVRLSGNQLLTERGEIKTYTSVDRALSAIRALGWKRKVEVDG